MTIEELRKILAAGEGTQIEFKESKDNLARSVYESICAMLNRRGGHVVLGVKNDGTVIGINPASLQAQLDTLAKDMNNVQVMNPTYYLDFQTFEIDGKKLIYFYVPESKQAHNHKGKFYDRNQDGDFELRGTEQIANLFIRKSKAHTEDRVYPQFTMADLDERAFDNLRTWIRIDNAKHPWLELSNEEIIRSAELILKDPETGKEGLTLAAILLFGNEHTIAQALPGYRIDVLCRVNDTMLYDDRDMVECNLLAAYDRIMAFIKKHLPEQPYIEGMQRFSLRDKILREVVLNLLIHREYSSGYPATFTIYQDTVVTENWNIPYVYGSITLETVKPHRKNPNIAKVFTQMGIVEELGSGTRKIFEYTPIYSNGKQAQIEEEDVYRVTIPFQPTHLGSGETTLKSTLKSTLKNTLKGTRKSIVDMISGNPQITIPQVAESLNLNVRGIAKHFANLQSEGIIRRVGPDKGGHWEIIEREKG